MNLVLAITTYNRLDLLQKMVASFLRTRSLQHDWSVVIADDGSDDGTLDYINSLNRDIKLTIIQNSRVGVHQQLNSLLTHLENMAFDICFKCDDDIEFIKRGWETLYVSAIKDSGFQHLCFFDPTWRPEKNLEPPITNRLLIAHCRSIDVQGSFFTLTPEIIKNVGFVDVRNFGFRGVGHVDYTLRACRLGFNDVNHPFDAKGSIDFIRTQNENYRTALSPELLAGLEDELETERKYALAIQPRGYIPYEDVHQTLDYRTQRDYLMRAIKSLSQQKQWYEDEILRLKEWEKQQYGHLPRWFVKIGKMFKTFKK